MNAVRTVFTFFEAFWLLFIGWLFGFCCGVVYVFNYIERKKKRAKHIS